MTVKVTIKHIYSTEPESHGIITVQLSWITRTSYGCLFKIHQPLSAFG